MAAEQFNTWQASWHRANAPGAMGSARQRSNLYRANCRSVMAACSCSSRGNTASP